MQKIAVINISEESRPLAQTLEQDLQAQLIKRAEDGIR